MRNDIDEIFVQKYYLYNWYLLYTFRFFGQNNPPSLNKCKQETKYILLESNWISGNMNLKSIIQNKSFFDKIINNLSLS